MEDSGSELLADPSRIALRLFLPGEDLHEIGSRVSKVVARILRLPARDVATAAAAIVDVYAAHGHYLTRALASHADTVRFHASTAEPLRDDQLTVLGASFTSEYAVEGAALCNPSAVPHPDQSDLKPGQLRVAVALRAVGEGHHSSIEFATAVIGPGRSWVFDERRSPLSPATIGEASWWRDDFIRALETSHNLDELTSTVVHALPETFDADDLEHAIRALSPELSQRHDARRDLEAMRSMLASAYVARFDADSELSQRVLQPVALEESHGMEDARFVRYVGDDGKVSYRATYTAYDGKHVAPRLIVTHDLREFEIQRLTGSAAKNKGVALFPRPVGGRMLALTRTDGENLMLSSSPDGRAWEGEAIVHTPSELWEIVQTGNCGSPIETEHGWLVLTHGVGPMRQYCIGAILLDLETPEKVLARLDYPMLQPEGDLRYGYVPNVVYSCGGVLHDGVVWLPYGVGDNRVRVASIGVIELVAAMSPVTAPMGPVDRRKRRRKTDLPLPD